MDMLLQRLQDWGCTVSDALDRLADDEELYISWIASVKVV